MDDLNTSDHLPLSAHLALSAPLAESIEEISFEKCQPAAPEKQALNSGNGSPTR